MKNTILWWGIGGCLLVAAFWTPSIYAKILWSVGAICAFVLALSCEDPFGGE